MQSSTVMIISNRGSMSPQAQSPKRCATQCDATFPDVANITSSTAIIVATTRPNIDRATELLGKGTVTEIIGADPAYSTMPSDILRKLDGKPGHRIIVVFSDQLTSSLDAPVLTSHQGRQRFLSLVEVILNNLHGFHLLVCTCGGAVSLPPGSPLVSILRAVSDCLDASGHMGSDWLVEAAQVKRNPGTRLSESRIRQRVFHSAVMHMYWKHPDFNPERFDQIHRELKNLYRAPEPTKRIADAH